MAADETTADFINRKEFVSRRGFGKIPAAMKFNLICDESGTSERHLIVGGLTLPRTNHDALAAELAALKTSKGFRADGEFKWGKVTGTPNPGSRRVKSNSRPPAPMSQPIESQEPMPIERPS